MAGCIGDSSMRKRWLFVLLDGYMIGIEWGNKSEEKIEVGNIVNFDGSSLKSWLGRRLF